MEVSPEERRKERARKGEKRRVCGVKSLQHTVSPIVTDAAGEGDGLARGGEGTEEPAKEESAWTDGQTRESQVERTRSRRARRRRASEGRSRGESRVSRQRRGAKKRGGETNLARLLFRDFFACSHLIQGDEPVV